MSKQEVSLSEEQQEVVVRLLRQGAKMERRRLAESLEKFSGKMIDVDQFIVALNGLDEEPEEAND